MSRALKPLSDKKRAWYILQGYRIEETKFSRFFYDDNGNLHREDGPAYENSTFGTIMKFFFLHGKFIRSMDLKNNE